VVALAATAMGIDNRWCMKGTPRMYCTVLSVLPVLYCICTGSDCDGQSRNALVYEGCIFDQCGAHLQWGSTHYHGVPGVSNAISINGSRNNNFKYCRYCTVLYSTVSLTVPKDATATTTVCMGARDALTFAAIASIVG